MTVTVGVFVVALEENVLTARQEQYLDWLCTAPSERQPSSKTKYAAEFGTTTQTLRNWEKGKQFRDEWQSRVDSIQGSPEKTHSLLENLYSRAMDGDMKAADLYLRATNRMTPPPVKVETTARAADLSDVELAALIASQAQRTLDRRVVPAAGGFVEL